MHTDATEGRNRLAEMVEACRGRGDEYITITDHSKAVRVAGGLTRAGVHVANTSDLTAFTKLLEK